MTGVGVAVDYFTDIKSAQADTITSRYTATPEGFAEYLNMPIETQLVYAEMDKHLRNLVAKFADAIVVAQTQKN